MPKVHARFLALVTMLFAVGNVASPQTTGGPVAGQPALKKGKVVMMSVADGKERGGDLAAGSGALVRSAVRDALIARGFTPLTSESMTMVDAVKEAKELGYDYILKVVITEWEDNATAWSGKKDSLALSLEFYDLTPAILASSSHRQKGSSFAASDSAPDRLLVKAVDAALGRALVARN